MLKNFGLCIVMLFFQSVWVYVDNYMLMTNFLVNIAAFNTKDEDYHEHIDNINDSDGKLYINLTVKSKQSRYRNETLNDGY